MIQKLYYLACFVFVSILSMYSKNVNQIGEEILLCKLFLCYLTNTWPIYEYCGPLVRKTLDLPLLRKIKARSQRFKT